MHRGEVPLGTADPTGFDLIVNATPAGMGCGDESPALRDKLTASMLVAGVITVPAITPLLDAARAKGCRIVTGVNMHDASLQLMVDFFFGPR